LGTLSSYSSRLLKEVSREREEEDRLSLTGGEGGKKERWKEREGRGIRAKPRKTCERQAGGRRRQENGEGGGRRTSPESVERGP
jgi:hypothetical protein